MDAKTGFFYLFSVVLLFAAFRVITARNPVHAVLYLILAFSQAAAVWLLLKAEFLAIALVLVYLGAVMVLFLFVVMMLDIHIDTVRKGFWKHFPLAALIGAVIALEMAAVLMGGFRGMEEPKAIAADEDFWERAHAVFTDAEIVDLAYCIACWMGLGRMTHVLGLDGLCSLPTAREPVAA